MPIFCLDPDKHTTKPTAKPTIKQQKVIFFEKFTTNHLQVQKIALPLPSQNNESMSFQAVNKFWWWRLQLQKSRE
jgi:hypothetical protein